LRRFIPATPLFAVHHDGLLRWLVKFLRGVALIIAPIDGS